MKNPLVVLLASSTILSASHIGLAAQAERVSLRDFVTSLFSATDEQPVNYAGQDLSQSDLSGLNFKRAILKDANMFGADLSNANLRGVNLSGAKLDRTIMLNSDFSEADLSGASLLLPAAYNNMETAMLTPPRFKAAKMPGARLFVEFYRVDFSGANLAGADFRRYTAGTQRTSCKYCDFSGADLSRAILSRVNLNYSQFSGANLRGADLRGADLSSADLTEADLTGALTEGTSFNGALMQGTKGFSYQR